MDNLVPDGAEVAHLHEAGDARVSEGDGKREGEMGGEGRRGGRTIVSETGSSRVSEPVYLRAEKGRVRVR